jgi:hypothetical protein
MLNAPGGVAVDAAGNVYFADLHDNHYGGDILKLTWPTGATTAKLSLVTNLPAQVAPSDWTELAIDSQGDLFIPDSATLQVYELPAGGYLEALAGNGNGTLPTPGPALGSGMSPDSIALGPNGAIYVGNWSGDIMKLTVTPPRTAPLGSKLTMTKYCARSTTLPYYYISCRVSGHLTSSSGSALGDQLVILQRWNSRYWVTFASRRTSVYGNVVFGFTHPFAGGEYRWYYAGISGHILGSGSPPTLIPRL